ncbi:MAG: addiction module protein [Victivallaceae bacterium]|nr:addiction module protein [Victivallaceae bacterium]
MLAQSQEICNKALSLPAFERIEIIENLFFSLDSKDERKRIDQLWAAEAEDRLNAYEKGEIEAIPASEVFQKINLLRT